MGWIVEGAASVRVGVRLASVGERPTGQVAGVAMESEQAGHDEDDCDDAEQRDHGWSFPSVTPPWHHALVVLDALGLARLLAAPDRGDHFGTSARTASMRVVCVGASVGMVGVATDAGSSRF